MSGAARTVVLAVMLIVAIGSIPSWLALAEAPPLSYRNLPFPVESPVRRGESLRLTVVRCNSGSAPLSYTFTRTVTNVETGAVWALPPGGSEVAPGCAEVQSRLNVLPDDLPPGTYVLSAVATIAGKFRVFQVPWRTAPFELTAP